MRIELPLNWVIALNLIGWPVIHLGVAWAFTRLPERLFKSEWPLMRPRAWEKDFYTRFARIRAWKQLLPDGAPWLKGFAKRTLRSKETQYLQTFVQETRRGEAAHWLMMFAGSLFFLWNPPWADVVMAGYAVAASLPCILTQRYNRVRLVRVLDVNQSKRA